VHADKVRFPLAMHHSQNSASTPSPLPRRAAAHPCKSPSSGARSRAAPLLVNSPEPECPSPHVCPYELIRSQFSIFPTRQLFALAQSPRHGHQQRHAKSAVVSSSTPGVFVATHAPLRARRHVDIVKSDPPPRLPQLRVSRHASSSSLISQSADKSAPLCPLRAAKLLPVAEFRLRPIFHSQASSRICLAASNKLWVANTFGFGIASSSQVWEITLTHPPLRHNLALRASRNSHYSSRLRLSCAL